MADGDDLIGKINKIDASGSSNPAPVGAGGSFAQGLTEGAAQMTSGAQQMLASAQSGQLKFDPETGQSLIKALTDTFQVLENQSQDVEAISQRTQLGTTAGGVAMSDFNQGVASAGGQAFAPAHRQFIENLKSAAQAIQIAMDNYTGTDVDNAGKFTSKG